MKQPAKTIHHHHQGHCPYVLGLDVRFRQVRRDDCDVVGGFPG